MATKPRKALSPGKALPGGNGKTQTPAPPAARASAEALKKRPSSEAASQPEPEAQSRPAKKNARQKAPAPPAVPSLRDKIHTTAERLKDLSVLPSLADTGRLEKESRPVDTSVAPPSVPAPDPQPSGFVDRGAPIPEHYGMDRLVAQPRDESWVFVYWELKGGSLERLRFQHSAEVIDGARWVLRVRSLNDSTYYMVDIDLRCGQWYLKTAPDTRMMVELGLINHQGDFVCVIPGNEVRTPRAQVSDVLDERWMIKREELESLIKASGAGGGVTTLHTPGGSRESAPPLIRAEEPRTISLFSSYMARHAAPPEEKK